MDFLFVQLQYLMPQKALTSVMGALAACQTVWLKNLLIRAFIAVYSVNMSEAVHADPDAYASFNDFFTRALVAGARPIAEEPNAIVSPADGVLMQAGGISSGRLIQAKGRDYSLVDLLGGDVHRAAPFLNGAFATIYLSPRDYHRVHMPLSGQLKETIYVPGRLFSVNDATAARVPDLFARNERLISVFEGEAGPFAVIMVGAMIVSGIDTVWGRAAGPGGVAPAGVVLDKGEEMGRFNMGSTVIVVFAEDAVDLSAAPPTGSQVRMGQKIGLLD